MKAEVLNELKFVNTSIMRLTVSLLCTLFLFAAYFLSASFLSRLIIFVFAMLNSRMSLGLGFDALCKIKPDANSFLFVSAFFALLQGLVVLNGDCFAYSALTLALFTVGEYISEKAFNGTAKSHFYTDRVCAVALPISLVLLVAAIILNLAFGEGMYETMSRAFLAVAYFCPCAITVICPLISLAYAKIAAENGVFVKNIDALAKLGAVKEIVFDGRGIVTDEEYSLYDIYTADGDKAALLAAVAAIESHFNHSFAHAVASASAKLSIEIPKGENCFEICCRGVGGEVNGEKYFIGNKKLFKEKKINIPEAVIKADSFENTLLYVSKNGEFFGVLLFHNRKKDDADFVIDEIHKLGKRCVLIAANEHMYSKGKFDILLCEREKVLQELKKGAKIKAMVVSQKPFAKADVTATVFPSDKSDIVLGSGGMSAVLFSLVLGRAAFSVMRTGVFASFLLSVPFALSSAFGIIASPLFAAVLTLVPLLLTFRAARFVSPKFTASEEDEMFGKINYTMQIGGMNCAHCSARVKSALESIKGVSAKISLEEKNARIKCSAKTTAEELAKVVSDVGFTVVSTERV